MLLAIFWMLLFTIVFLYLYLRRIIEFVSERKRLIQLVDKLPGPHAIPLLGCAYQFKWNDFEFLDQLKSWATEYGPKGFVRIWVGPVPLIFVTKVEAVQEVLDSKVLLTKSSEYDVLAEWLGTGLLNSKGEKWRSRRKMLTPTFHFNILIGFCEVFAREAQILADQVEQYADTDQSFDLFPYLKRCALDVICETSMGTKVNAQIHHDSEYVMAVKRLSELIWKKWRLPWFRLKPVWYLTGYKTEFDKCIKLLTDFTRKVISERSKQLEIEMSMQANNSNGNTVKKRPAFLDLLLMMKNENKLTYEDIREEVDTFMYEGHETTSSSMGWTLWYLGHNPHIQQQIFAELDDIFGDSDRPITVDDLKEMKYLERCLKEGLRLCPAVPLFARQVTEDTPLCGYTLPRGATVVISTIYIHRDKEVFPNPEDYDPDNFLPERIATRNAFAYIPFSAGQRNCIGQKFALMEEKMVIATLFRKYEIKSTETADQVRPMPEIILKPPKGFEIKLFRRHK